MSKERSPRAVCSTTIGTKGMGPPVRGLTAPWTLSRGHARQPASRRGDRSRSALALARRQEGALQQGAVEEAELPDRLEATVGAPGAEVAVLLALVGPFAANVDRAGDGDAAAAGDLGDHGFDAIAVATVVNRFDPHRDDEGGRDGNGRVEVCEDGRIPTDARPVEDGDWRGERDRRLF